MSIIYVGLDVHTSNYTFCCYSVENDRSFAKVMTAPDYREVLKYLNRIRQNQNQDCEFLCGYESGCLGYSPCHQHPRFFRSSVIRKSKRINGMRKKLQGV